MTKPAGAVLLVGALLAAILLAALPTASAHGALPSPPLFHRIGDADDDGQVGPGGCNDNAEAQTCDKSQTNAGGLDLLSLDAREAYLSNGTAAVDFLVGYQRGAAGVQQTVSIFVGSKTLSFHGPNGGPYNSTTCDRLVGPYDFPGGDGLQKAVECWVTYAHLGIANGTAGSLSGIHMQSDADSTTKYDVWPGAYYLQGRYVAAIPDCDTSATPPDCDQPEPNEPTDRPGYALTGPADLLKVTLSAPSVDLGKGSGMVHLMLAAGAAATNVTQLANLTMDAPATIQASLDAANTKVSGNGTSMVMLNVVGATKDGTVRITVTTDLGGYAIVSIPVKAAPPPNPCGASGMGASTGMMSGMSMAPVSPTRSAGTSSTSAGSMPTLSTTSCPPTSSSSSTTSKSSPAPALGIVLSTLAVALLARRRL